MDKSDLPPEDDPGIADSAKSTIFGDQIAGSMLMGEQLLNLREPNALIPLFDQMIKVLSQAREHFLEHTESPLNQVLLIEATFRGLQEWIRQNREQLPIWIEKALMLEIQRHAENN